ncbi:MAG: efflux RND transporter periplasmic adaptor subunit [Gammaproteobacteria bacterium]
MNRTTSSAWAKRGFLALCLLHSAAGCSPEPHSAKDESRPVRVFRVRIDSSENFMTFAGEIRPRFETVLSFRVAGKVISRTVEVGDRVEKGQVLAALDRTDYQLSVDSVRARLKAAATEREFVRDELERHRELLNQGVVSPPDFDKRKTAYLAVQERVASLQAQLDQSANQLQYTQLIADHSGVVTTVEANAGQVVQAGQPIAKIARPDQKEVHVDVPENRINTIKINQKADVFLWHSPENRLSAVIREIAPSADPSTRTYRVKAALEGAPATAQLGMTASVRVDAGRRRLLSVPLSAVFTSQDEPNQAKVWLVDEQQLSVRAVPVQLGGVLPGDRIEANGLQEHQLIVSAGVQRLREGQRVRLPAGDVQWPPISRSSGEGGRR